MVLNQKKYYSQAALQLITEFSQLPGWEQKYKTILKLANTVDLSNTHLLLEEIKGCENKVWLGSELQSNGTMLFYGKSDSRIVRGLLALLLILVNGQTAQAITELDIDNYLTQLHFTERLSLSRQQGLTALIEAIKKQAASHINMS